MSHQKISGPQIQMIDRLWSKGAGPANCIYYPVGLMKVSLKQNCKVNNNHYRYHSFIQPVFKSRWVMGPALHYCKSEAVPTQIWGSKQSAVNSLWSLFFHFCVGISSSVVIHCRYDEFYSSIDFNTAVTTVWHQSEMIEWCNDSAFLSYLHWYSCCFSKVRACWLRSEPAVSAVFSATLLSEHVWNDFTLTRL